MGNSVIRVLICDDQWIVCEGLEAILESDHDLHVVGIAHDGAEAIEQVAALRPDVVLMDLRMPGVNGIQATRAITESYVRVLVLTTYGADEWVFDAIRSGADGYLLKGTPRRVLLDAIKGTAAGQTHVDPAVAGRLFEQITQGRTSPPETTVLDTLSNREQEVLRLLARGLSNAEIASRLSLSQGTVRNYVSAILAKLNVSDRTQAALLALRYGLVGLDEL
jgi:DNA-binding NarL/FixJ family response regulator